MKKLSILAIALILCAFCVMSVSAYTITNPTNNGVYNIGDADTVDISFTQGIAINGYYIDNGALIQDAKEIPCSYTISLPNNKNSVNLQFGLYTGQNTINIKFTVNYNYVEPQPNPLELNCYIDAQVDTVTENSITYRVQCLPSEIDTPDLSTLILYSDISTIQPDTESALLNLVSYQTTKYFNVGENGFTVYSVGGDINGLYRAPISVYLEGRGNYTPPTPTETPTVTPTETPTTTPTTQPTTKPPRDEDITTSGDFDLWLATSNSLDDSAPAFKLGEFTSSFIEGEKVYFDIQNFDYVAQVYGVATVDFEFLDYDTYQSVYPTQRFKFNWSENGQWQYKSDDSPTIYNIGENNAETWRIVSSCKGNYLELPSGKYRLKVNLRYGGGNIGVYSPNLISTAFYTDIGVRESGQSTKVTFTIENIDFDTGTQLTGANVTVYEYSEFNNQLTPIYQNSNAPAKIQILVPSQSMLFIEYNKYGYEDVNAVIFDYLDNRKGQLISAALLSSRLYYTRVSDDITLYQGFIIYDGNTRNTVEGVSVTMDNSKTVISNQYGGVMFENVAQGMHTFVFTKNGYSSTTTTLNVITGNTRTIEIFKPVTPTPTGAQTLTPTPIPTDFQGQPIVTPIGQPKSISDSVKYGLAKVFGITSLDSINLVFALIIILFPAVVGGVITNQSLAFVAGGMIGFVIALGLGLIPIWVFFAMVMFAVIYLILTTGNNF